MKLWSGYRIIKSIIETKSKKVGKKAKADKIVKQGDGQSCYPLKYHFCQRYNACAANGITAPIRFRLVALVLRCKGFFG